MSELQQPGGISMEQSTHSALIQSQTLGQQFIQIDSLAFFWRKILHLFWFCCLLLLSLSCEISITCALTFFTSNNDIISQFLKERFETLLKLKNNSQTSACSFLNHCSKLL